MCRDRWLDDAGEYQHDDLIRKESSTYMIYVYFHVTLANLTMRKRDKKEYIIPEKIYRFRQPC
jgi:hypothetical protein